jgi:hypothetical protein
VLSYAGVYLTAGIPAALQEGGPLALSDLLDFARPTSPGRLSGAGFPYLTRDRRPRLNSLYWPTTGVSRFAYGHFLADDNQLALIRPQAYASNQLNPLPLILDDGNRSVTTNLSMLAVRPLASCGAPALNLLTLVDARYFLRDKSGTATTGSGQTWDGWFHDAFTSLGATFTQDTINAAYPAAPTDEFDVSAEDGLPGLIDAAAHSLGMRVVCTLDGVLHVITSLTGATTLTANVGLLSPVVAGGYLNLGNVANTDVNSLPGTVSVAFPIAANGVVNGAESLSAWTLAALVLPAFGSATGSAATQQIRLFTPAIITTNPTTPDNATALTAIAKQAATDWYNWQQLQTSDLAFDHVCAWVPSGTEDSIEWGEKWTRLQRPPWNDRLEVVRPPIVSNDSSFGFVRLTGLLGDSCGYLDGFLQTIALQSGSGSGSGSGGCYGRSDANEIDVLDLNAGGGGSGSGS